MRALTFLAVLTLLVCALVHSLLGINWLTIGYGLHPVIAFPVAVLCLCAAIYFAMPFLEWLFQFFESSDRLLERRFTAPPQGFYASETESMLLTQQKRKRRLKELDQMYRKAHDTR